MLRVWSSSFNRYISLLAQLKEGLYYRLHREDALAVKYLCLVLCVTPDHVGAAGLEIPRCNQDHITILDPDPPLHLASYAADSVGSV